jgi:hypothetical protein
VKGSDEMAEQLAYRTAPPNTSTQAQDHNEVELPECPCIQGTELQADKKSSGIDVLHHPPSDSRRKRNSQRGDPSAFEHKFVADSTLARSTGR